MSRDANEIRRREGLDALREEIDRAHQTAGAEPNGKEDDQAEIERLAQLSSIKYDQERKALGQIVSPGSDVWERYDEWAFKRGHHDWFLK
jgi:hypothetical protein